MFLGDVAFQVFDADLIVGGYRVHDCSESDHHPVLRWANLSVFADQRVGNVRNAWAWYQEIRVNMVTFSSDRSTCTKWRFRRESAIELVASGK
jgi:hypothetical protein